MNDNKLILLHDPAYTHVSKDTIIDVENEVIKVMGYKVQSIEKITLYKKIIRKMCFKFPSLIRFFRKKEDDKTYFWVCMGKGGLYDMIMNMNNMGKKIIYVLDAWEPTYQKFEKVLNALKIDIAFFHSEQMADHFRKVLTHTKCYWIPEGINIQEFHSKPCEKRNIDILQMGRKYDRYHDMILPFCIKSGIKYVYEKEKGKIIFKDKSAFIEGLASTKISICTPQSITNPEKVGIISTITQRYLQSMSSKCLILGIIPKDMEKVFNYRPLIPIDMEHPQEQIKKILKDYKKYTPLIEQNYVEVKKHHQWKNRIEKMQDIINTTINHHI